MPSHLPRNWIVAAAVEAEIAPLRELNYEFLLTGVGLAQAAANTARFIELRKAAWPRGHQEPDACVLFIGSCGSTDHSVPIGSLVFPDCVHLSDVGLTTGESFLPCSMVTTLHTDRLIHKALANKLTEAIDGQQLLFEPVYSVVAITRNTSTARSLSTATGARFENLELFGLATACTSAGIPWLSLSCVANHTHPAGHEEWLQNRERVADVTAKAAIKLLGIPT